MATLHEAGLRYIEFSQSTYVPKPGGIGSASERSDTNLADKSN